MRKILSVLLTLSLILPCVGIGAFAETAGALSISAPVSAVPGETINVTVAMPAQSNAIKGSFNLIYDNAALEVVSCTAGTILSGKNVVINPSYSDSKVRMTFDGEESLNEGGLILNAAFKVLSGSFGTVCFEIEKFKLYDENYEMINVPETASTEMYIVNEAETKISVSCNPTVNTGDELTVKVDIANALNVCGGGFNIVYDAEKFALVSAKTGDNISGFTKQLNKNFASNKVRLTWAGYTAMSTDGTILTLCFKAKHGVAGEATFKIEKFRFGDLNGVTYDGSAFDAAVRVVCTHSIMDWIVTTSPTCLADGEETYMCGCGYSTDRRTTKATGHQNMQWVITKAATCDDGGEKSYTCADCGYVEKTETVLAHGHEYENIVTLPTKADKGFTTHRCKYCGDSYVDSEVDALGYQIIYDANGGENAPSEQNKRHGEDIVLSDTMPTRIGYTFLGWATDKDAENAEYYAGNTYAEDKDVTFYALWHANAYTVTYIVDGEITSVQTYNYGDMINAAPEPAKPGYTFSGWSDIPITMPAENIEITGSFMINSYTVVFDANGGENAPENITDTYLQDVKISEKIPKKEGCSFLGWAKKATAKKVDYKAGDTISLSEDITLYAVWQEIWNGTAAGNFDGGNGTKTNPYRIATAAQLAYLAERVNAGDGEYNNSCYILVNNIALNDTSNVTDWAETAPANEWTAIGTEDNPFCGTFDGNGYAVSGLYISKTGNSDDGGNHKGLFGFVTNGLISNLGIESGYLKVNNYSGGIVGGSWGTTIKKCYNKAAIVGNTDVGGIVGALNTQQGEAVIADCYNEGNITANTNLGGIIGLAVANKKLNISGCSNAGSVNGADTGVGGLVGYVETEQECVEIDNCFNLGTVYSDSHWVGGIVGYATSGTSKQNVIKNCYNKGAVAGKTYSVGGIIGQSRATKTEYCYNIGKISADMHDFGGIAGFAGYGSNVLNCFNASTLEGTGTVGGIVGAMYTLNDTGLTNSIENCYNIGAVTSTDNVGGICGFMRDDAEIKTSINIGTISSSGTNAGAIVGYIKGTVTDSYYLDTCGKAGQGTALNYVQMQSAANYSYHATVKKWSWKDAWQTGSNPFAVYPMLKGMYNFMENPIEFDLNGGKFDEYELCASVIPSALNGDRDTDFLVLYTDKQATTGTNVHGYEVVVNSRGIVTDIQGSKGNAAIPKGGFVLSGHGIMFEWLMKNISLGDKVTYNSGYNNEIYVYKKNPKFTYATGQRTYLPTPTREGYVFSGWYDENDNLITYYRGVNATGLLKLHAKWTVPQETNTITYNGNVYKVFDTPTAAKSAEDYCKSIGGHLVTITSAEENAQVMSLIANSKYNTFLTGANDSETEGSFVWNTGELFSYTNWKTDEPNNSVPEEDAVVISKNGGWNDHKYYSYISDVGFICEIENLSPSNSKIYNGHLYQTFDKHFSWYEAKEYCEKIGGHLATVTTKEESDVIISLVENQSQKLYWLGGTDEENEGEWRWITGEEWGYANWYTNQPDNSSGKEHYLHIYTKAHSDKRNSFWNDLLPTWASSSLGFVCEFDSIEPVATATYNGHEYRLYDAPCSWKDAEAYCASQGGYLATIADSEEQSFVYNELLSDVAGKAYYRIGGHGNGNEWIWYNGEELSYINWSSGEPTHSPTSDRFLAMLSKNAVTQVIETCEPGKWIEIDNFSISERWHATKSGFICEFGNTEEYTPVASFIHNGHYYEIYDKAMQWNYAKDYCEKQGGHLVTITSAEEQSAIEDAINSCNQSFDTIKNYWLGATDFNDAGTMQWITGEPFEYSNWASGRPKGGEYHWLDIQAKNKSWYDWRSWYDYMGFICEYETIEKVGHTVTYDANGGLNLSKKSDFVEENKNADLSVTATREGYTFLGWNTDKNATEPLSEYSVTGDVTLYAVWKENKLLTVTYDANGGENAPDVQTHKSGEPFVLAAEIPQRTEYTFVGWATNKDAIVPEYLPGEKYTYDDALYLYAVWKPAISGQISETVSWSIIGGVLNVDGADEIPDYTAENPAPWYAYHAGITEIKIDKGIESVGNYAFYGLSAVKRVEMDGVTDVGEYAFSNCYALTDINTDNVVQYGSYAFRYCTSLTKVTVKSDAISFGSNVYANCSGISDVVIAEGVTRINFEFMSNCGEVDSLFVPDSVISINENAFAGTAFNSVTYSGTKNGFSGLLLSESTLVFEKVTCKAEGKTYIYRDFFPKTVDITDITFDKKSIGLHVGESSRITAEVMPSNATEGLVWNSDNISVASVDDSGNVMAVGEGVANITAMSESGKVKASCVVYITHAAEENVPTIRCASVNSVKNGESFDVKISLENNPGIVSMRLSLTYDKTAMTLTNVTDMGMLGEANHSNDYSSDAYTLYWDNGTSTSNFTKDGEIVTLTFAVKDSAKSGDYPIVIAYDYNNSDIINCELVPVKFEVVNGYVTVKSFIYGDVNNDGKVNALDSAYLSRYIAKWTGISINLDAADVNKDGKVNALDSAILKRYIARWQNYKTLPH